MAAGADAAGQPLAHGPGVPGVRPVGAFPPAWHVHRPLRGDAQLAAAAAAGIRHVGSGAGAAVHRRRVQRPRRAGIPRVPAALLRPHHMARRRLRRLGARLHLEPPVVPGLPVDLHAGLRRAAAAVAQPCRPRMGTRRAWTARLEADAAAGAADRGGDAAAAAALRIHWRLLPRLVSQCAVLHRFPVRLVAGQRHRAMGRDRATAPAHAHRGGRPVRLLPDLGESPARRCSRVGAEQRVAVAQHLCLVGAVQHPRLGACAAEPPVPLAAVGERVGVSLVRAAPEPDRAHRMVAAAAAPGRSVRIAAGAGRHGAGLLGDHHARIARSLVAAVPRHEGPNVACGRRPRNRSGRWPAIANSASRRRASTRHRLQEGWAEAHPTDQRSP